MRLTWPSILRPSLSITARFALLLGVLLLVFLGAILVMRRQETAAADQQLAAARQNDREQLDRWIDLTGYSLRRFVNDYAQSREAVELAANPAPDWSRLRLQENLSSFSVHAAWVLRADGTPAYAVRQGDGPPWPPPVAAAEFAALTGTGSFPRFFAESAEGLVEVRGAPLVAPVNPGARPAPRGWLLAARRWDEQYLGALSNLTESRVRLLDARGSGPPADDRSFVAVRRPLNDWRGRPLGVLDVQRPATDMAQAARADAIETRVFVAFGLLVVTALALSLRRWVLQPLAWIGESLERQDLAPLQPLRREKTELSRVAQLVESAFAQKDALLHEIEERKRTEADLSASQEQLHLAMELRSRLARDLHDGVIQSIYAAGLGLEGALVQLRGDPAGAEERLRHALRSLNETIREVRNFITGLESEQTRRQPFPEVLAALVATMRSLWPANIALELEPEPVRRFTNAQELHTLQIVREGVSNAMRHGEAAHIQIRLGRDGRDAVLEVRDDGRGFDATDHIQTGSGLANMAARAKELRGTFHLHTGPDKGTCITVRFPLADSLP